MNKKLLVLSIVFLMTHSIFAFSGTVGIQLIQHDPFVEDVRSSSLTIEGVLLDTFFDCGYVVSNSPVVPKKDDSRDESIIKGTLKESLEGRVDLLVLVTVNYNVDASPNPNAEYLNHIESVSWKIVNVVSQKDVARKDYAVNVSKTARNNNKDGIKTFSGDVAWDIISAIKKID